MKNLFLCICGMRLLEGSAISAHNLLSTFEKERRIREKNFKRYSRYKLSFYSVMCEMRASSCKAELIRIFSESVNAVNPAQLVAENLKLVGSKLIVSNKTYEMDRAKFYLIGFGKAVLGMASQTEKILGKRLIRGIICIPEGTQIMFRDNKKFKLQSDSVIEVFEGAKDNMPDEKAEKGADAILNLVSSLNHKSDKLIALISGGGSALFPKPKSGLSLKDKLHTISCLASSGANINELNTVRKKISSVKGGGLAHLSYPTQTICLILSDVLNDSLDIIASGPTTPNLDDNFAALEIIKKYNLTTKISARVLGALQKQDLNNDNFTLNQKFSHVDNFLIGNNQKALEAAKHFAEMLNFVPFTLSHEINGCVEYIADFYYRILQYIIKYFEDFNSEDIEANLNDLQKNCSFLWEKNFSTAFLSFFKLKNIALQKICIIAGGEPTVKLKYPGKGGRNQELTLLMLTKIFKLKMKYPHFFKKYNIMFLSAGTDGIDGPTDVAGAIADQSVFQLALKNKISPDEHLMKNDSYHFFSQIDNGSCFIKTGHTGTNVADIHLLAIYEHFS